MFDSRVPVVALLAILCTAIDGFAQSPQGDLSKLSVDDLMDVEVTSVARRGQKLSDTPAAVFVITQDDIQRSGATTIPEVLRMVPGVDVASVDGNIWAISARGFNGRWSNKLLVMIDGRTVYSPVFSGVYWDIQDTMLEDIDRIEVIRGPGGTLWGANAVNGIINIITKNSVETQGVTATAGGGSTERAFASLRYGGSSGDNFHFRVFGKTYDRQENNLSSSLVGRDAWQGQRAGFRADWVASPRDNVSVQGEMYRGTTDEALALFSSADPLHGPWLVTNKPRGGDVVVKWTQTQSTRSETSLQVYGDYAARLSPALREQRRAFDVDFQHQLSVGKGNELVWGLGYRRNTVDAVSPLGAIDFQPSKQSSDLFSAFVQDEVRLPHNMKVTIGSKVQYDRDSGAQFQPTLRGIWHRNDHEALWGALTHAVRTPALIERNASINVSAFPGQDGLPVEVVIYGNHDLQSETEDTAELGYRWQWSDRFSLDATTFYERLNDIINSESDGAPRFDPAGHVVIPLRWKNNDAGDGRGLELSATARLTDRWDLSAGYSWLRLHNRHTGDDDIALFNNSPRNQVQLRSLFAVTPRLELDLSAYYVDRLIASDIPAYLRIDARLAWHPTAALELSVVGQNLFDDKHLEFTGNDHATAVPINRSIYGKVTWHF